MPHEGVIVEMGEPMSELQEHARDNLSACALARELRAQCQLPTVFKGMSDLSIKYI